MDQPPTPHRAGLAAGQEVFCCPLVGNGANPEQGEVERAAEVPPSHWVDATDELLLADLGSSLVTFAEALLCASLTTALQGLWPPSPRPYGGGLQGQYRKSEPALRNLVQ